MSLETKFWDPSKSLPYGLRNATELFERELAQHACPSLAPSEFVGMVDGTPNPSTTSCRPPHMLYGLRL
jgi:hypothetical protein